MINILKSSTIIGFQV